MKYRRCHALAVLPEERPSVSLQRLLSGDIGLHYQTQIRVYAAHIDQVCSLDVDACVFLLGCSAEQWQAMPTAEPQLSQVGMLVGLGLLLLDDDASSVVWQSDRRVRAGHWWPLSAIQHRHSRWSGIDSVDDMERRDMVTAEDLVRQFGRPPLEAPTRQAGAVALPRVENDVDGALLMQRVTCRNYDLQRPLALTIVAAMLQDVLMAQEVVESEPGVRFLKKNVPSAGGMHPLEAYVVARDVQGLEPGIYHYHAVAHELAWTPVQPDGLGRFTDQLLAGQHWFADAHVLVILVCRFQRNFWKYRRHAKAYRAVSLEAGHISQAVYAAATKRGLGAFVTAAINEVEAESVLQFDPMVDGVFAVCGFGWRAQTMRTDELDPGGHIWEKESLA